MKIEVELYGIPRRRCGVGRVEVSCGAEGTSFGNVLTELSHLFPDFADSCVEAVQLSDDFTANIDGKRFITDPNTLIRAGQTLLIMSADAGG